MRQAEQGAMRKPVRAGLVLLLLLLVSTTSVAQWGEVQERVCPASYEFATAEVQREPETSCSIVGTSYTVCAGPSCLTDSELGPQDSQTFNSSYYYTWQGNLTERYFILFTFSQTESISNIILHYYVHNLGDTPPAVNVFGVEDDFEIQSPNLTGRVHHTIIPGSTSSGLHSASIIRGLNQAPVNISTTRIILQIQIRGLQNTFRVSEVEFRATTTSSSCPDLPHTTGGPTSTEGAATSYSPTHPPSIDPPADSTATTTGEPSLTVAAPVTTASDSTATTSTEPPMTTDIAIPPVSAIAARLSAGLAALTVLTVAAVAAVVVGGIVYKRRGRKRAGKGVEFAMAENKSYTRTTQDKRISLDENGYAVITTTIRDEHMYENIFPWARTE